MNRWLVIRPLPPTSYARFLVILRLMDRLADVQPPSRPRPDRLPEHAARPTCPN